jgi:hypothetical protein
MQTYMRPQYGCPSCLLNLMLRSHNQQPQRLLAQLGIHIELADVDFLGLRDTILFASGFRAGFDKRTLGTAGSALFTAGRNCSYCAQLRLGYCAAARTGRREA